MYTLSPWMATDNQLIILEKNTKIIKWENEGPFSNWFGQNYMITESNEIGSSSYNVYEN